MLSDFFRKGERNGKVKLIQANEKAFTLRVAQKFIFYRALVRQYRPYAKIL
jgi:hypothetical protein